VYKQDFTALTEVSSFSETKRHNHCDAERYNYPVLSENIERYDQLRAIEAAATFQATV